MDPPGQPEVCLHAWTKQAGSHPSFPWAKPVVEPQTFCCQLCLLPCISLGSKASSNCNKISLYSQAGWWEWDSSSSLPSGYPHHRREIQVIPVWQPAPSTTQSPPAQLVVTHSYRRSTKEEWDVSGPPWWNMAGFRQRHKQVCTAFNTRTPLGEFLHIKSSIKSDINLYCTDLKNKSGLSPCRQREFSSTAHLALSLKFFQSSDKLLKVIHS